MQCRVVQCWKMKKEQSNREWELIFSSFFTNNILISISKQKEIGCSQTVKDLADDRFYIPMKGTYQYRIIRSDRESYLRLKLKVKIFKKKSPLFLFFWICLILFCCFLLFYSILCLIFFSSLFHPFRFCRIVKSFSGFCCAVCGVGIQRSLDPRSHGERKEESHTNLDVKNSGW